MRCEEARDRLLDLVYEELPPEDALALRRHAEACPVCAEELRAIEATLGALDAWGQLPVGEPFRPAPALEALRAARSRRHFWSRWAERGGPWEVWVPALGGIAFAALSFFLLRDYVTAAGLSATTHVLLGVLSGGLWAGLCHLALRERTWAAPVRLQPTAWAVLIATFLTCVLLYLAPVTSLLARPPLAWLLEGGATSKAMAYLLLGMLYAAIPFAAGGWVAGRRIRDRLLPHAVAGVCIYLLMIAPDLGVVCAPFGLGIYLSMLAGTALGGLGGAFAGLSLVRRA